jgi:nucleoside-diphosphate-sugar epimerase
MAGNHPGIIAVTGATGLLGRHLCHFFHEHRWEVRGLVRAPSAAEAAFANTGIRLFKCDLPERIDQDALEGVNVLIHCAYMTHFTNLTEAKRVNEEGTRRILKASHAAGVRRFVFVSSTGARCDARSYYGRSKYLLEGLIDPGRDLVIRPGLILARDGGLFQRIVAMLRRLPVIPIIGGGQQIIQTVHVENLCQAFERAIICDLTGSLTIAEPQGLTMKELLQLTAAHLGRRRVMIPLPNTPMLIMLRFLEVFRLPFPMSSENLLGLIGLRHVPTAADLQRLSLRVKTAKESLASLFSSQVTS